MKRVGFVGVGSIGAPMARCVIRAGYEVTICDKSPRAREGFAEVAARLTDQPSDCADTDVVIVVVTNDAQLEQVMLGEPGILAAVDSVRPPLVAVMSTVLPQTVEAVAAVAAPAGVRLIDAPVSGLPVAAEKGELSIMVGGEVADLEAMRPVLEAMGNKIFHTGPLGSGEVAKLVNNIVGATNMFLTVEAMGLGKQYGMDLHKLAAIMENSSGRNFSTQDWDHGRATFAFFAENSDLTQLMVDLCRKDLQHAQVLAKQASVACPLLDQIANAAEQFGYEEIGERWRKVT